MPPDPVPALSIVMASYSTGTAIDRALGALESEVSERPVEVVVVESAGIAAAERLRQRYSWARIIGADTRLYPGDARNRGIAASRGRLLAFVDADTIVAPGFVDAVFAGASRARDGVVFLAGAVDNATRGSLVAWANHFCEFALWLPAAGGRRLPTAATCSMAISRGAFERYGQFVSGTYCSDTVFAWRAVADGNPPEFEPGMLVRHIGIESLPGFVAKRLWHGRAFARVRVGEQRFSTPRRLAYAAAWPAIAVYLFLRCARLVLRRSGYRWRFVAVSPLVLLGMTAWALGEAAGYLSPRWQ